MNKFKDRLNEAISLRGISKAELARRTGIGRNSISDYTNGKYEAKQDNLYVLANVLNVNEAWLMGLDTEMDKSSLETIYQITDIDKEVLSIYHSLPDEAKDKWIRNGYDLQTEYHKKEKSGYRKPINDLIKSLLNAEDLAVRELANSSKWLYDQTDSLNPRHRGLLEDALLLIDSNKTKTAEFINLKRKIYEAILPLPYFVVASDKGARSIGDVAKRYRLSKEFVIEAILYYVTSRGSIIDDDSYLIDFNNIPLDYDNIDQVSDSEIVITDTDQERVKAKEKTKKKGFFRK
ncbi:helix-turn-helix domain-containing protein [Enterococcus rotai]|uniref:helix-turn-helix domain-containing protein n=1 Tax=Enterococcus rotai TaxID=118060 RepID=UPI0032B576FD